MPRVFAIVTICTIAVAGPAAAQVRGTAGIEQVPGPGAARTVVRVAPVDATRSSATVQSATAEKVPPAITPEALAACRLARAQDRPAPKGVDCVKAMDAPAPPQAPRDAPTAEVSLLNMLGQNLDLGVGTPSGNNGTASADQVSRQLSSGDFQGNVSNDAAASVVRGRAAPEAPPPR